MSKNEELYDNNTKERRPIIIKDCDEDGSLAAGILSHIMSYPTKTEYKPVGIDVSV